MVGVVIGVEGVSVVTTAVKPPQVPFKSLYPERQMQTFFSSLKVQFREFGPQSHSLQILELNKRNPDLHEQNMSPMT